LDATSAQTLAQWLPSTPQKPVKRTNAIPGVQPDTVPASLLTKQNQPQLPGPLPAHNLGVVDDKLFSLEPQSGLSAAPTSVAPTVPPTDTPIAQLRQLVITADGEWIDALARDIVGHAASDNQLAFTLIPEQLGQLDVAVTTDNGKVDIRLETSTHAAAQAIATEQARLIEDLRHAGLKLGQFDMSNRQNGNGQQQAPRPDSQHTDNNSTPAQASASSKAQGRFA
jgi:flagellar hook-length control protein FliK